MPIFSSGSSPRLFGEKLLHGYDHPTSKILHTALQLQVPGVSTQHGSANPLTQIVCHLVGIPEILHAKADDINEILYKPEQLLGIWPYLQREGQYLVAQLIKNAAKGA